MNGLLILLLVALVAIPEVSATSTIKTAFDKVQPANNSPLNTCDIAYARPILRLGIIMGLICGRKPTGRQHQLKHD
jgi:hypothetical protein